MNSFKIGLELKKLVFKKKVGQGEWLYVSAESKKEASGKKEIVDLLQEETSWESLSRLRGSAETDESFCKTVRKQVAYVLFENEFNKAASAQTPIVTDKVKKVKKDVKPEPSKDSITITSIPEDNDVKPLDVRVFRLAPVPVVDGVLEADDDEAEASVVETVNIQKIEEETDVNKKVLIFNIDKTLPQKRLKEEFFDKIDNLISVKQTVTADAKYRGVYLATFSSPPAAREFVSQTIDLESKYLARLDKVLLRDYRVDRFFQRQIMKSRNFKRTQGPVVEALADLKKTEKLAQCVIIEMKGEVEEELVNEYFSGLESSFVDTYELEDLPRKLDSTRFSKYALVFQSVEDAKDFVTRTDLHRIEEETFRVSLLSDLMRKIRYGEKSKNFSDSQYSEAENDRRIVIGTVRKESTHQEVQAFVEKTFSNVENVQRCMSLDFFLGAYVLTFVKETDAKNALEIDVDPFSVLKNPITMSLGEYTEKRDKFLKDLFPRLKRKRSNSQDSNSDSWVREFEEIKDLHSKFWGDVGEEKNVDKYDSYDSLEEEYITVKTSGNIADRLKAMAKY